MSQRRYFKEFAKYICFNVLGMVALSCYILMDTWFVSGRLGAGGLAALNLAIPVYNFIHGAGLMLGIGGGAAYSVCKSRGEKKAPDEYYMSTLILGAFFAAVFFLCGIFGSGYLTGWFGADAEVFGMTECYMKVLLLFSPCFLLNDILICFVRNDGNPRLSMCAMLVGSLSNILLDYLFLFPLGLGIFGAVFATGLSAVISILILSAHWWNKKNGFHLIRIGPDANKLGSILGTGFSSFVTEASSGIVIIVFNMIFLRLRGNTGVAAYGVVANLSLVVTAVYTGIAQGVQPLISRAWGEKDAWYLKHVRSWLAAVLGSVSALVYALLFLNASGIAGLFNSENNQELLCMAEQGIRLYFTAVFFVGFNIVLCVYLSCIESAGAARLISMLRGLLIIVPAAFLMSALWGENGVWLAYPAAELCTALAGGWIFCRILKKERMTMK